MIERVHERPLIYRVEIPLPENPLQYLNSYILPGKERACIIDTGFHRPECREALQEAIRSLQIDLKRTDVFLTHVHGDHSGLADDLADAGGRIYMNPEDYAYFVGTRNGETWNRLERMFCEEGFPKQEIGLQKQENHARIYSAKKVFPITPVRDGDKLTLAGEKFIAIQTPGHSKGHMCLYLPIEEIMFTGDHILFDITPNIARWLNMDDSLKEYLNSLDKISNYVVKTAFPAHRTQHKEFNQRIQDLKTHHDKRLEEAFEIVRVHPGSTGYEIASKLTWSMRGKKFEEFSPSQKWFAMGEALAHLDYLLKEGRLKKTDADDAIKYEIITQG